MKNLFVFDFSLEEEEDANEHWPVLTYGMELLVDPKTIDDLYQDNDFYMDTVEDIEMQFGVHDWGSGYDKEEYHPGLSFTTYEVSRDNIPELLKAWSKKLDEHNVKHGDWKLLEITQGG